MTEGETYTLSLDETGYAFRDAVEITVPIVERTLVPVTVDWVSHDGFQITFAESVDRLYGIDIVLKDDTGERVVIPSVTEKVAGRTFVVRLPLTGNKTYTFTIALSGHRTALGNVEVADTIALATHAGGFNLAGFTVNFSAELPGLTQSQFILQKEDGEEVSILSAAKVGTDGQSYEIKTAREFYPGNYRLFITAAGYDFGPYVNFAYVNKTIERWGTDAVYAGLNPTILGLDASNFPVTNSSGQAVATVVSWQPQYGFYLIEFPRVGGEIYTISVNVPGYDFGAPRVIDANAVRFDNIQNVSAAGFRLTLSPAMIVDASDFVLKDSLGHLVELSNVTMNDSAGSSYNFAADLAPGSYSLSLTSKPNVSFPAIRVPKSISLTLDGDTLSRKSFTVGLSEAIPGLGVNNFPVVTSSGSYLYPVSVATTDNGLSYKLTMGAGGGNGLNPGAYTIIASGTLPNGISFNSGAGVPLAIPEDTDVTNAVITDVSATGFAIAFSHAVPGLTAANAVLKNAATNAVVSNLTLVTADGGMHYRASAALVNGQDYKVSFAKAFYVFDAENPLHVNLEATASVRDVTSNGFRLMLNSALPGLNNDQVIIRDAQGNEIYEEPVTSDSGASYLVKVGNVDSLGWGRTYTVDIRYPGYTTPVLSVTTPVVLTIGSSSESQVAVMFNAPVTGLTATSFKLVDETGASVAIGAADTEDDGLTYALHADLPAGRAYWLSYLPDANYLTYDPLRFTVKKIVSAEVTSPSLRGFTLRFHEAVPDLQAKDLLLKNSAGARLPFNQYTPTTTDQGLTYKIAYTFSIPEAYTVDLASDAYGTYQDKFALVAPVGFDIPIPVKIVSTFTNNDYIVLSIYPEIALEAGDFSMKDENGEEVTFGFSSEGNRYTLEKSVTEAAVFYLAITKMGYDFGPVLKVARNIAVVTSFYNQTQTGLTLSLNPGIPDLEADDIAIKDESGNPVAVDGVETDDFGRYYRVHAALTSGTTYSIALTKDNYVIQPVTGISLIANGAVINNVSAQGFKLNLLKKLDSGYLDVLVTDDSGKRQPIQTLYSSDGGLTYHVGIALAADKNYKVRVQNLQVNMASPGNDYGQDQTVRLTGVTAAFGGIVPGTGNRFVVSFSPAQPDLEARDFRVTRDGREFPVWDAVTEDDGATYVLTTDAFVEGVTYRVALVKDGYDFGAPLALDVPYTIIPSVSNIGARSVGIALNPARAGLAANNFTLKDAAGHTLPASSATTADGGATYTIAADFTGGQVYTIGIAKIGYYFGAASEAFIPSEIAPSIVSSGLTGVVVSLSPSVAGLRADSFSLALEGGESVAIDAATTTDGGATYTLSANLVGGRSYSLGVALAGYVFNPGSSSFHVDIPATVSASGFKTTGFKLAFDVAVPGLTVSDLALRDAQEAPVAISSVGTTDGGLTYTVQTSLTLSAQYRLTVAKTGYRFAADVAFMVPIPVPMTVAYVSEHGFAIGLGHAVPGLSASDLNVTDSSGAYMAIATLTTDDNGANYVVAATLEPGETYTIRLSQTGYDFGNAATTTVQQTIALSIGSVNANTFRLNFSRPVPNFYGGYLTVRDEAGNVTFLSRNDVSDASGAASQGNSFDVKFKAVLGTVYTVEIRDPDHPFGESVQLLKPIVTTPSVSDPIAGSFVLTLGSGMTELVEADISLYTEDGEEVTGFRPIGGDTAGTYRIVGNVAEGTRYTLKLHKRGYDFGPDISFLVPIKVAVAVTNEDTNGFTVSMRPGVDNVAISLKLNGQTVAISSATTTDGGNTYQVRTNLGANTVHQLQLVKAGYDFGAPLSVSNKATAPSLIGVVTNDTGTRIVLNFDKPLVAVPNTGLFSIMYNGRWLDGVIPSLSDDRMSIVLNIGRYYILGSNDIVEVTFVGSNTIKAVNGTYLAAFADIPVNVATTALGYAMGYAQYDGYDTAQKLKDGYRLSASEAGNIMRQAGFRTDNYARAIRRAYELHEVEEMAVVLRDMQVDGLTALTALGTMSSDDDELLKALVAVGYKAAIFVPALRASGYYSSKRIATLMRTIGVTNADIAAILKNNLAEPASVAAVLLRDIGVSLSDTAGLLATEYGLGAADLYRALKDANISAAQAAGVLRNRQSGNPSAPDAGASSSPSGERPAVEAVLLLNNAGYGLPDIGAAIAPLYGLSAGTLVRTLKDAGFGVNEVYIGAGKAFARHDVAITLLSEGHPLGNVSGAVKAAGDSDGAKTIAYAVKHTGRGVGELFVALKSNGYSVQASSDALLSVGYGLPELAALVKQVYELDVAGAYPVLEERFPNAYFTIQAPVTIFQAMIGANYAPEALAKYYLDRYKPRYKAVVILELRAAGLGTHQALRIVHDIQQADGNPLTLESAFGLFSGFNYFTSDEVLSAVLYAFAGDPGVSLDVQSVGQAFYSILLRGWSTECYDRAKELRNRMGMTMKQWIELQASDGRVCGYGVSSSWAIIRDTLALFYSSTVTLQDVVGTMSTSDKFSLDQLFDGIAGYWGSYNVEGIMAMLKNTGVPMQNILGAIEANPARYGTDWVSKVKRYGLMAGDVVVYFKSKGLSNADIVTKISSYSMDEIVLALRSELGLGAAEVLPLLAPLGKPDEASRAVGYVYREAERDVAVKLLKLQGYSAAQVGTYLSNHNVTDAGVFINALATAGFTKAEVTKVVLERYYGVNEMPGAIAALRSVYGGQEVGIAEVLAGAGITKAEDALEFMATHRYELTQMVAALKSVYNKTSGETTSLLTNRFGGNGGIPLSEILSKVTMGYSSTEESTLLDVLAAANAATPQAAIVTLRRLGYDKIDNRTDLTIVVRVLKNGYGLDAGQATDALLRDGSYNAVDVSGGITAVYQANNEIGTMAKVLIGAGITDAASAVRYMADKYAGIGLTARVLKEIYQVDSITAISRLSVITRYAQTDIFSAVQTAYGTDPTFGYLAQLKIKGATAYQAANEFEKLANVGGSAGRNSLVETLIKLGYDKESVMYEYLMRYRQYAAEDEIAPAFVKAGFTDATGIAKQLLRAQFNPNQGYTPARIIALALPGATRGGIAAGMKNAGFTSEAVISGMLTIGFNDSVAAMLKELGFTAARASAILQSAGYPTGSKIVWLKRLGYPLKDYFQTLGNRDGTLVALLKSNGYSATEIAQELYRANLGGPWIIKYLDEGGFTDLATLVTAYYRSGQPLQWVIHDIYQYGTTYGSGETHRWPLMDVVRQLLANETITLSALAPLINYANNNNLNETFRIIRELSTKEQTALHAELGVADAVLGEHVPNIVAMSVLRSIGLNAATASTILKSDGGVGDWKMALLILFMTGYSVDEVFDAVLSTYRVEIGIQVLTAIASSGFGQIIKDWDKYKFAIEKIVQLVSYGVKQS
ncbi:MAG: hypothetical protein J7639_26660 [Paenibacillaceae bacterium]|nr:hypothetical protein [Paenibacillaceae bacterium]